MTMTMEKEDRYKLNLEIMSCKSQKESNRQPQQNSQRADEQTTASQSLIDSIASLAFQSVWRQACVVYS